MDDLHCYTCRENSVREAEEHNSLVKNLKKKNQNGSLKKRFKPNPHHKTQENHICNPHNNFINKLQKHQTVDQSSISAKKKKKKKYPIHIIKHKTKMYKNPKRE